MVNKVFLIGNMGKDPEVKYTPSGDAVVNFTLATSESWKDKQSGEKRSKTEWHSIVAWRRLAEIIGEYLHKGSRIYVEGKLQTRSWETDDGSKRYKTEVVINEMKMLGDKGGASSNQSGYSQQAPGSQSQSAPGGGGAPGGQRQYPGQDDDIPF